MTSGSLNSGSVARAGMAEAAATPLPSARAVSNKFQQRVDLRPAGMQFGPAVSLAWMLGAMALGACAAPWLGRGWWVFDSVGVALAVLIGYDGLSLWLTRNEYAPCLLASEKGLRGSEGRTIQVPLALVGSTRIGSACEIRVGIMPSTAETETAIRATTEPQQLKLERKPSDEKSTPAGGKHVQLWPWTPEVALLRRGIWPGPRVGIERKSRLKIWRLRRWFDSPEPVRIEADLRAARQEILRSPIYRSMVAAQQTPWTGHGREFERLREYQPGDNYSEIAWKPTARRGSPVTRLFQWEQKQEIYFVVDQSRASALALDKVGADETGSQKRTPRRLLDLAVETALVGATVALELGDEFGLVTYADEPKSWLRAGSGQSHFHEFRERLLSVEPLPTTADYETLFAQMRIRLRRRAYLLVLADLTERSVADSLRRGVGLVRSSHALLMTSILPLHAKPAFSPGEQLHTDHDVYASLASERENQRLGTLARQMRQLNVQLRYIPAEMFLRTAVEGYLESKREQRL